MSRLGNSALSENRSGDYFGMLRMCLWDQLGWVQKRSIFLNNLPTGGPPNQPISNRWSQGSQAFTRMNIVSPFSPCLQRSCHRQISQSWESFESPHGSTRKTRRVRESKIFGHPYWEKLHHSDTRLHRKKCSVAGKDATQAASPHPPWRGCPTKNVNRINESSRIQSW